MTITFKQLGQVTTTAFSNFSDFSSNRGFVFNPTLPALWFDYSNSTHSYDLAGIIVGTSQQQQLYSSGTGADGPDLPILWFANAIIGGGGTGSGCGSGFYAYLFAYNLQTNTFNFTCASQFRQCLSVAVDYINLVVYLWVGVPNGYNALVSIPFKDLQTFITTLTLPSSAKYAYIYPVNPPSGFDVGNDNIVYYNNTFYISAKDSAGNYYIWVVPLSGITWYSSLPSTYQQIGTVYQIYGGGGTFNGLPPLGNITLNYYVHGGQIVAEILAYIPTGYNSSTTYYSNLYIYSFNPNTNSATQLFSLQGVNVSARCVNIGGLLVFSQWLGGSTYVVAVYDRKTNTYQTSQQFTNLLSLKVLNPGYVVAFSGSPSNMTVTVYQIIFDTTPVITNLKYNNNILAGTVINLNGNQPLSGVSVYLFSLATQGSGYSSGNLMAQATTDNNGNFGFIIGGIGYYAIKVIQPT